MAASRCGRIEQGDLSTTSRESANRGLAADLVTLPPPRGRRNEPFRIPWAPQAHDLITCYCHAGTVGGDVSGWCLHWTGPQPPAQGDWGSLAFPVLNGVADSSPAVRAFEIRGMAQKLGDFLKDETATAAIEYGLVAAGLAVLLITGVRPANSSPTCPTCGLPMRFVATIPKFSLNPELRAYKCRKCEETALEEWGQGKCGCTSQRQPLLLRFFLTLFAAQFLGTQSDIDAQSVTL